MAKQSSSNNILFNFCILIVFAFFPSGIRNISGDSYSEHIFQSENINKIEYPSVFPLTEEDKEWIENQLIKMTTGEKCAQMIVPWQLSNDYTDDTLALNRMVHLYKDLKVGGVIISTGDAINAAININKLQAMSEIPLLVSADFETGLGYRLSDGTNFPFNMALVAAGNINSAFEMGRIVAIESKAIGVFQNYAPDVDINNNSDNPIIGTRSYSEDKITVAKFANELIDGAKSERFISTVKHFPGHGNTTGDSHLELPVVNGDTTHLLNNELYPFIKTIENGVQAVMVGHLYVPAYEQEKGLPSSLSKAIVTGLLKNKLGFDGLVITDALNMQAVTKYYSVAESALLAVKAGNDILLMPPDEDIVINTIVNAVQSGEIDIKRINTSVRKILAAKRWLQIQDNRFVNIDKINEHIGTSQNKKLAQMIADNSITLVKNSRNIIPIHQGKYKNVLSIAFSFGIKEDSSIVFHQLLKNEFNGAATFILNNQSKPNYFNKILHKARSADLILLPYFMRPASDDASNKLFKKFANAINKMLVARAPTLLISFGDPYLLSRFRNSKTYLSAFSDVPVSQKAMIKALLGEIEINGKLPVSLPKTFYKAGYGIKLKVRKTINSK